MNETELERLVVRLTGDGSEYAKMLQQAQVSTNAAAAQVQQAASRIEGFSSRMGTFATGAVAALSSLGAGGWLRQALGEWQTAEDTAARLEAAISSNGRAVGPLMDQYRAFASEIQNVTTIGDDATLAVLAQAESFNISGDAAVRATRAATAFSAINGGAAENYLRLTAAMEQGNIEQAMQIARMVPQLRGITNQAEFLARAQQLVASGMEAAQAKARTFSGQIAQLKNAYGDFLEEIGQAVAEVISPFIAGLKSVVKWFSEMSAGTKQAIAVAAMLVVAIGGITAAITVAGFVFNTMFGGVGLLLGLLATVGVVIGVWVSKSEGVAKAWENLKAIAMPVIQFIRRNIYDILTVLLLFTGPIGWIIAGILQWVKGVGGLTAAWEKVKVVTGIVWDWVKAKVLGFWTWAQPIVAAGVSFMITSWQLVKAGAQVAWEAIKAGAEWLWNGIKAIFTTISDFILGIWESIFGASETTWDDIATTIATAITGAEFVLKNFEKVASYVWTLTKLGFVTLVNEIEYFFTTKLPAWLGWFAENFVKIHVDAFNLVGTALNNLSSSVVSVFSNLPGLIAGTTRWEEVWTPLAQGFQATMTALPNIGQREMGALERELTMQAGQQAAELQQLWEDFELQQLDDLEPDADTVRQAENAGNQIGTAFGKGADKGMERFDGVLSHSAEAITRLAEYRDRIGIGGPGGTAGGRNGTAGGGTPGASQSSSASASNPGQQLVVTRLTEIRNHLKTLVDRPQIQVEGAELS